jgi:hypothetical protein
MYIKKNSIVLEINVKYHIIYHAKNWWEIEPFADAILRFRPNYLRKSILFS